MSKPILCVDWDGVIHSYTSPWRDATIIPDPPVQGALRWLWKATEWFDVRIYSSRSKTPGAIEAMRGWLAKWSVDPIYGIPGDWDCARLAEITFCHEKPAAFLTVDDRAITFDGDFSVLDPKMLLSFKPWNKRK